MAILNLRFLVLKNLSDKGKSGYELIKYIEGVGWKPSPGSMYPLLKQLIKEKVISIKRRDYHKRKKFQHLF